MGLGKAGGNKDGCGKMRSIRSGQMEIRDLVPDSPEHLFSKERYPVKRFSQNNFNQRIFSPVF